MNGTQHETESELLSRIDLIESMVQEGRKGTEYWGWVFVLWGAAYLIAIAWSYSSRMPQLSWPVTMIAATILTVVLASRKRRNKPQKPLSRAISAIWIACGAGIFIFCFSVASSGRMEVHSYFAAVELFLGVANCASSIALRWRGQFLIALLWFASAIATCFVNLKFVTPILLFDAFFGFLCFGLYLMYREQSDRKRSLRHA